MLSGDTSDIRRVLLLCAILLAAYLIRWTVDYHKSRNDFRHIREDIASISEKTEENAQAIALANKRQELLQMMTIDWNRGDREQVIDYMYSQYIDAGGDSYMLDENGSTGEYHRYKDRCKELRERNEGAQSYISAGTER
jgi:hypothetical protein